MTALFGNLTQVRFEQDVFHPGMLLNPHCGFFRAKNSSGEGTAGNTVVYVIIGT